MPMIFSICTAAVYLGVSIPTLRRWDRLGKLVAIRTPGGHRRYRKDSLDLFLGIADDESASPPSTHAVSGVPYLYARVSSARQQSDGNLDRQVTRLEAFAKKHFGHRSASGLNPLRPGLHRLIRAIQAGKVSHVLIAYPDRLTRFGFPFLEWWFREHGVSIVITEPPMDASLETEFVQDIMAILTCFSGKLYKTRALHINRNQRQLQKIQLEFDMAVKKASEHTISGLIHLLTS